MSQKKNLLRGEKKLQKRLCALRTKPDTHFGVMADRVFGGKADTHFGLMPDSGLGE